MEGCRYSSSRRRAFLVNAVWMMLPLTSPPISPQFRLRGRRDRVPEKPYETQAVRFDSQPRWKKQSLLCWPAIDEQQHRHLTLKGWCAGEQYHWHVHPWGKAVRRGARGTPATQSRVHYLRAELCCANGRQIRCSGVLALFLSSRSSRLGLFG